jgi:hypothetical protein
MIPKNCNWPVAVDFPNARSRLCDTVCRAINRKHLIANRMRANNTAVKRVVMIQVAFLQGFVVLR